MEAGRYRSGIYHQKRKVYHLLKLQDINNLTAPPLRDNAHGPDTGKTIDTESVGDQYERDQDIKPSSTTQQCSIYFLLFLVL